MKPIIKKWIEFAYSDLDAAKRLFVSHKPNNWTFLLVLWHCHQTIEKMIKMLTLKNGNEVIKIHDLPRLYQLSKLKLSNKEQLFLKDLNEFYIRPRYPDLLYMPLPKPNRETTQKYLNKTKKFFLWAKNQAQNSQKK